MPNIGPLELAIVLLVVLLIFGPKRLPGLGRQLGSGMREFKDSITGKDDQDEKDDRDVGRERDAFGNTPELDRSPAAQPDVVNRPAASEPEVVSGDVHPQDQRASRGDA